MRSTSSKDWQSSGLVELFAIHIAPRQCSCLGLVGSTIVLGCADGTLHAREVPLDGAKPLDEQTTTQSDASITHAKTAYDWLVDTGAGPQARGLLRDKRRFFDGWARSAVC